MATTYDEASLVLIPSGTKTSKIFSQKPVNGDGDFTFSRSTAATRVNADGNIEKETQNLFKYSNAFTTSPWTGSATWTSGQADKDGGNNAWLFAKSGSSSSDYYNEYFSGVQTFSIYVKKEAGKGIAVYNFNSAQACTAVWNIETGAKVVQNAYTIDTNLVEYNSNWWRFDMSVNVTSGRWYIYATDGTSTLTTDTLVLQDAQLEQGLVARDYIETTTAAVEGGITDNVPRLDYTDSSCPALLLEPQRTNLLDQSEYVSSWSKTRATITTNAATSPEGVDNASALVATAVSDDHFITKSYSASDAVYTYSAFLKKGNRTWARLWETHTNVYVDFNLDTGAIGATLGTIIDKGTEDFGDGWYRCYFTYDTGSAATNNYRIYALEGNNDKSYLGDGTSEEIYIYGAQLEEGSYATSYIPTYGSAVTRNGESIANVDLTNIFTDSSQGTFVFEFDNIGVFDSGADARIRFGSATDTLQFGFYFNGSDSSVRFYDYESSGYLISDGPTNGESAKFAVKFQDNEAKGFVDGALSQTRTGSTYDITKITWFMATSSDKWALGFKKILFFPKALTDAECIDLTT